MSRTLRWAAAGLAVAALGAPALASADSIVYESGGEIWTMRPDGTGKVQLTSGGGWHSPTQSDDGTIAAVQGTGPIVVMARDGRPLRTITTPGAPSGDGGTFAPRPVDLSLSPDGSKIAYAYVASSCPVASSCGTTQRSTFYTRADVSEATPHSVWGNQFGVSDPEWVSETRALVFGGSGSQVSIDDLGPGDYSQVPWMTPNADMGDGELSRDGTRLVTTFDYGDATLIAWFAVVRGDARTDTPPPVPEPACNTASGDAGHADPSFSPDGTGTAWQDTQGIQVARFTEFAPNRCATTGTSLVAPGGHSPDWGPADPVAVAYRPPAAAPGGAAPAGGAAGPVGGAGAVAVRLKVAAPIRQPLRGRTLRIRCTVAAARRCAATARVRVGGRNLVARGSTRAAAGRAAPVVLRFSPRDARALRAALARRTRLAVVVTVTSGEAEVTRRTTLVR